MTKRCNNLLEEYQKFTPTTAIYPGDKALEYLALGLVSEAGEVAGKVKKYIRDGWDNEVALKSEVGDCLWYISEIANYYGWTLEELFVGNRDKLIDRANRNVIGGSGDNR